MVRSVLAALVLVGCGARSMTDVDLGGDGVEDGGIGGIGSQDPDDKPGEPVPNTCGNGVTDLGEACDGGDLGGETCMSVTLGAMNAGALRCTPNCGLDTSGCFYSSPPGTGGYGQGGYAGSGGVYPPPMGIGGYYGGAGPGPGGGGYYGMGGTFGRPPLGAPDP